MSRTRHSLAGATLAIVFASVACGGRGGTGAVPQPLPARTAAQQAPLPGCSAGVAARLERQINELDARVRRQRYPEPAPPIGLGAARAELEAIWQNPCLLPLARFFPLPEAKSQAELEQLFAQRLGEALRVALGAKWSKFGERVFVIPPVLPRPLATEAERALLPWLCAAEEPECGGRAASYIARAEAAFDKAQREQELFRESTPGRDGGCRDLQNGSGEPARLEEWVACAVAHAPWTHRYAPRRYRAPESGWLVLRGRRGHYEFADEIRAYDLETGSAYVARSTSALVLDGPEVDHAAADRQRKLEVFAGRVVPDQVRELAFVLTTLSAVTPTRTEPSAVLVPPSLGQSLGQPAPPGSIPPAVGPAEYRSSNQTGIVFSLIEAGKARAAGEFTWPDSANAGENHADELLGVLEAGLERRCPRVTLPRGIALGSTGAVSPIDADPARLDETFRHLAQALERFAPAACADRTHESRLQRRVHDVRP